MDGLNNCLSHVIHCGNEECGKQIYLDFSFVLIALLGFAYDRAVIKFRDYEEDVKQIGNLTNEEFIQVLRRQSTGSYSGASMLRGAEPPQCGGQWDVRMGDFTGNKGFENLIQQYNQQAAMASLEHSHHYLDMVLEATDGAGGSGAKELDLGIAPPSEGDSKCRIAGTYCNGQSPAVCRPDGATHFKIFCRSVDKRRAEAPHDLQHPAADGGS
ncbi:hypothetical protein SAY87_002680 [Trapa incisa]|uniref:Uncharacterized protein n=1 Tax=Trapa incisa TaxID=236973 RepID=A0AAN7PVI3_9MYRT|nr:hypothetical protein SAY87_002680 [Trapa incisa]